MRGHARQGVERLPVHSAADIAPRGGILAALLLLAAAVVLLIAAVAIAVLLARLVSDDTDAVFYAGMGAMVAMDTTLGKSLRQGLTQFLSVIFGTFMGYLALALFSSVPAWFYGLGILFLILLCNGLKFPYTITLSGIVFLSACSYPTDSLWADALKRISCTGLGLLIALLINVTLRPYNNKKRLRSQLRRLQRELPKALEQMVNKAL